MDEPVARKCIECQTPTIFAAGDGTCPACGLSMYIDPRTDMVGRRPGPHSFGSPLRNTRRP